MYIGREQTQLNSNVKGKFGNTGFPFLYENFVVTRFFVRFYGFIVEGILKFDEIFGLWLYFCKKVCLVK